jgi:hypothetical protein
MMHSEHTTNGAGGNGSPASPDQAALIECLCGDRFPADQAAELASGARICPGCAASTFVCAECGLRHCARGADGVDLCAACLEVEHRYDMEDPEL